MKQSKLQTGQGSTSSRVQIEVRAFACLAKTVPDRSARLRVLGEDCAIEVRGFIPKFHTVNSTSIIPSRLAELHQTLVAKREWACLVLPSGRRLLPRGYARPTQLPAGLPCPLAVRGVRTRFQRAIERQIRAAGQSRSPYPGNTLSAEMQGTMGDDGVDSAALSAQKSPPSQLGGAQPAPPAQRTLQRDANSTQGRAGSPHSGRASPATSGRTGQRTARAFNPKDDPILSSTASDGRTGHWPRTLAN